MVCKYKHVEPEPHPSTTEAGKTLKNAMKGFIQVLLHMFQAVLELSTKKTPPTPPLRSNT